EDLGYGLLCVLSECLVNQYDFLEEAGQTAFNDLGKGSFWLALCACGLISDATLVSNLVRRNFFAGQVDWRHCCGVHCNIVCNGCCSFTVSVNSHQNANLCWQVLAGLVQVSCNLCTLNAGDTADNDLLA